MFKMIATNSQKLVFNWINEKLNLPIYADGYLGAVMQALEKKPGYITFMAHFCRDLMNGLAKDYNGIDRQLIDYRSHVDKIKISWDSKWMSYDSKLEQDIDSYINIPINVCNEISILIKNHDDATLRSSDSDIIFFSTFLDYQDRDSIPPNFINEWKKAKEYFMKLAHHRKKPFKADTESKLIQQFKILDKYLLIAAKSEYERLKVLDEILDKTNN